MQVCIARKMVVCKVVRGSISLFFMENVMANEQIVDKSVEGILKELRYYVDGGELVKAEAGLAALKAYRDKRLLEFMERKFGRQGIDAINATVLGFERAVERLDGERQIKGAEVKRGRKAKSKAKGEPQGEGSKQSKGKAEADDKGQAA